ncbi:uncharacterized protein RCH25_018266 [Pelodytes ibericus]
MGRILVVLLLIFGSAYQGHPFYSVPVLHSTYRHPDVYVVSCSPRNPVVQVVQVHWKEKHANGTYSMIGVQSRFLGNHAMPSYEDVVKLSRKGNTTYVLEVQEAETVVCCEFITYPHGVGEESCMATEVDTDLNHFKPELLATLLLCGVFILGSFAILCHLFRTSRRHGVHSLRGSIQRQWIRSEGGNIPYNGIPSSRNLAYNPLSMANQATLPQRNVPYHKPQPQRNRIPPEVPPPRNRQHHRTLPMRSQWPSENVPPEDLSHPTEPIHGTFWAEEAPPMSNVIYSNVMCKKPVSHQSSWGTPHDFIIPSRPIWTSASHCPEDIAPPQPNISHTDMPLSTINPMYHSGAQWPTQPRGVPVITGPVDVSAAQKNFFEVTFCFTSE